MALNMVVEKKVLGGFALPTIIIASLVMLIVLAAAVQGASASSAAINAQYYNQLASDAAESGLEYARSCLAKTDNVPAWASGSPLRPNTDCAGTATVTCSTNTDERCAVLVDSNLQTTFSVNYELASDGRVSTVTSTGTADRLRTSNNEVWRRYSQTSKMSIPDNASSLSWKQVSAGDYHTCAIASDNQAYCWGRNTNGQLGNNSTNNSSIPVAVNTSGVLAGKTIRSITARYYHTCAIASDNNAYCWGGNSYGQLGNNSTNNSSIPVAVNTAGALAGKAISSIAAGYYHTCAIASDNQAYCWGHNAYGQLGNNSTTSSYIPVAVYTSGVLAGKTVQYVASGDYHTCAIASDNQAYCWGNNGNGRLGNNLTTNSSVPVAVYTSGVLAGKTILSVAGGRLHTCAIASDNQAYCWGSGSYGQMGNGSTSSSNIPVAITVSGVLIGKTISSITAGEDRNCAIASDNQAYCWGYNSSGQLGDNTTTTSNVPVAVNLTSDTTTNLFFRDVATGESHTCAIASDNQAYCWGSNTYGQLGNNSTTSSTTPVAVDTSGALSGKTIRSISVGYYHTCAIASVNQVYCWGRGDSGRLGNNSTANSSVPVPVSTSGVLAGKTIRSISAGGHHTCAIASDNQAYCWGINSYGQLGNNSTTNSSVPVAVYTSGVLAGKTIRSISAGENHTCAIASDGKSYCWGYNYSGQLGNNSTTNSSVPVAVYTSGVLSGKIIWSIAAGASHTCAITSDNNAYCWGTNSYGQLGNNLTANSSVPVTVAVSGVLANKTIVSISAGYLATCALASDNNAYCVGYNYYGQLGNNSTTNSTSMVAVSTSGVLAGKTIISTAAGYQYTCALASDNQAYCWGRGDSGRLGNGSTAHSSLPVGVTPLSRSVSTNTVPIFY